MKLTDEWAPLMEEACMDAAPLLKSKRADRELEALASCREV
jgi:hypothetical protein